MHDKANQALYRICWNLCRGSQEWGYVRDFQTTLENYGRAWQEDTLKLQIHSQNGCIPGMFAVTATDQYSLLRKAVHMCYGQMEIPRSHLVVHVLIADVDVPVLTLEKSTGAADLSKYGNSQKKSKSQLPLFQWEFTAVSFVVAIKKG